MQQAGLPVGIEYPPPAKVFGPILCSYQHPVYNLFHKIRTTSLSCTCSGVGEQLVPHEKGIRCNSGTIPVAVILVLNLNFSTSSRVTVYPPEAGDGKTG